MINPIRKTDVKNPIAILIGIILIFSCTYWHEVSIKYLIPEGYEGMIIIAWDQQKGIAEIKEGAYEVYKIPANGFLRSQVKSRSLTILEEQFYSYNKETGKETKLEAIDPSITTDTITKRNQFYKVGLLSGGHGGTNNMIFFIAKNTKSKFMDETYRRRYLRQHEDELYKNSN